LQLCTDWTSLNARLQPEAPMLATKPAGASPRFNLAAATTQLMWTCALATARVTVASAARGLELWSHVMRRSCELHAPAAPWHRGAAPPSSAAGAAPPESSGAAATPPAEPIPFASYRSSGGHAAAQVRVRD
jgi:hypothetical protein